MKKLKADVIEEIKEAYKDVKLDDGIGLWEAQAIDDWKSVEEQKKEREKDEKEDWSKISSEDLKVTESSLSFFDADGFRFHIPAFMIADLNFESNMGPIFNLTSEKNKPDKKNRQELIDLRNNKVSSLTKGQVKAIINYLEYEKQIAEDSDFVIGEIDRSLKTFWYKFLESKQ